MSKSNIKLKADVAEQDIHFITNVTQLSGPGIQQHSGGGSAITRKAEEVKQDFNLILNQLNYIIAEADQRTEESSFKLDEVTVSLGFSAKGKIAFIAEAGIEASIEVKFTRKP